ncbi:MAG: Uma2 family endonuclease [Saprospiraceae bacterium]
MSNSIKVLPHYTYDEYRKWEGRWELLEGIPYAMSPTPAPKHQRIVAKLHQTFLNALDVAACLDCTVYDFIDVKVEEDTIVQPDLLFVCNEISKPYLDFPPNLVIEVLSPATALKDRNNKFYIYQNFGIQYYVIVDIDSHEVEVYVLNKNGKYTLALPGDGTNSEIELTQNYRIRVDWSKLWN